MQFAHSHNRYIFSSPKGCFLGSYCLFFFIEICFICLELDLSTDTLQSTTQPRPQIFSVNLSILRQFCCTIDVISFLPNSVDSSWLWWIMRGILSNQKRRNSIQINSSNKNNKSTFLLSAVCEWRCKCKFFNLGFGRSISL